MAPVNPRTTVEHIDTPIMVSCHILPALTVSPAAIDHMDTLMLTFQFGRASVSSSSTSSTTSHAFENETPLADVGSSEDEQLSGVFSTGVADSGTTITSDHGAAGESESTFQASTCIRTPGNGCA